MKIKLTIFIFTCIFSSSVLSQEEGREFAGIKFGIGISLTHDTGNNDRVESASLDENGVVRVSKDQNDIARIMLETHYFFEPNSGGRSFLGMFLMKKP